MKIDATEQKELKNILDFREQYFIRPPAEQPSGSRMSTSGCSNNMRTGREANQGRTIVICTNDIPKCGYIFASP